MWLIIVVVTATITTVIIIIATVIVIIATVIVIVVARVIVRATGIVGTARTTGIVVACGFIYILIDDLRF
jgi:hypothetical protein